MSTAPTTRAGETRRVAAQCGEKAEFSKIQQSSSSSQDLNIIKSLDSKSNSLAVHERVGKVEKRLACMRQPFASEAVAFNSARMLSGMKLFVHPEKCRDCKLWHLTRENGGPDQP